MKLQIYDRPHATQLEEIEVSTEQASAYAELVKKHGYSDENAEEYKFDTACLEFGNCFVIYVEKL